MAKQRVTESRAAADGRREKEAERRRNWALTRKNFLDSQGPPVVELTVPRENDSIDLIMLMRRVDLATLARSEAWPQPLTAAARKFMYNNGLPTDEMLQPENIDETLAMCAAITKACIIVPPPEWLSAEIDTAEITEDMCRPFFVDEDPDDDQVILRVPGAGDEMPEDKATALATGYLHPTDLIRIASAAYTKGPGGTGSLFRFQRAAVEAVPAVEAPAESAA